MAVESGEWAVEEVRRTHFDAVFLDLVMPGVGSAGALIEIRVADPATKVMIVTGYPKSALMMDARSFDPDRLLAKPFGRDEVHSILHDLAETVDRQ